MTTTFGDDLTITLPEKTIRITTQMCDILEYDCMSLVQKFADAMGLEIKGENDPLIDFSITKKVEETILEIFEENGIKLEYVE